jgi:hypothetical protein
MGSSSFGEPVEILGIGAYLDHARNYLNASIISINYTGKYSVKNSLWQWGLGYRREVIADQINEWKMVDSLGFTLPLTIINPGEINMPSTPIMQNLCKADNLLESNRINSFIQNNLSFENILSLNIGARLSYWNFNNELLFSPRASLIYTPPQIPNMGFRFSTGIYYQPPFYRELRDINGKINHNIKSQRSIHIVGAVDYDVMIWDRPFKLLTEFYYKKLDNLIPYEIDNIRVLYTANNNAKGYATGVDFRLNGEFVEDAESWISLSLMKTQERIGNSPYIPRPTDQRLNMNIFFQDHITDKKNLRISINLVLGTGLPYGNPDAIKNNDLFLNRNNYRLPAYKRLDMGFSYQPEFAKFFKKYNIWLWIEVFNIFDINNTNSYVWISDLYGTQYGIANYLTPRLFNIKLSAGI